MSFTRLAVAAALLFSGCGGAVAGGRGPQVEAAFHKWAARQNVTDAVLAAANGPKLIAEAAVGPRWPSQAQPVYGLSRPISAACAVVAKVQQTAGSSKLGVILKDHFEKYPPKDDLAKEIEFEELISQDSLFMGNANPNDLDPFRKQLAPQFANGVAAGIIPLWARDNRGPSFNDLTYVGLALSIEATMHRLFQDHCKDVMFKPLKISRVTLEPILRSTGMWGAWKISISDYARFLEFHNRTVPITHSYHGFMNWMANVYYSFEHMPYEKSCESREPGPVDESECVGFISWYDYSYVYSIKPCASTEALLDRKKGMLKAFFPGDPFPNH